MTDNGIIKALEGEIHLAEYADNDFADNVSIALLKDTLDLINRQKAEIERLQKEVGLVSIQFQDMQERQEESQAEIEGLKEDRNNYQNLYCLTVEDLDTAKLEAIKEFAERLKNKVIVDLSCGVDSADYLDDILFKDIDNLVNKMVGENNGNLQ